MSTRQQVLKEVEQVPEPLLEEVLDFIRFLRAKASRAANETALASEQVLAKDWLKPEEDEAWQDL